MDIGTKTSLEAEVRYLMEQNPPMLGEGYLRRESRTGLRVRMAYQRWLLMKVAPSFPQAPLVEVVEVIAPMIG